MPFVTNRKLLSWILCVSDWFVCNILFNRINFWTKLLWFEWFRFAFYRHNMCNSSLSRRTKFSSTQSSNLCQETQMCYRPIHFLLEKLHNWGIKFIPNIADIKRWKWNSFTYDLILYYNCISKGISFDDSWPMIEINTGFLT